MPMFGISLLERDSEGRLAFQRTDLQDREANDLPGFIDFFHHGIVIRLSEVPFLMGKEHLKIISFLVIPDA